MERPPRCPVAPGKCCCKQQMHVYDGQSQAVGSVYEKCWICVPQFEVLTPNGDVEFLVHQPTCCNDSCIDCCPDGCFSFLCGCCNCKVPFYVYNPQNKQVGEITKVWTFANAVTALFADAHTFELKPPANADAAAKARLLAATMLVNQIFFQRSSAKNMA